MYRRSLREQTFKLLFRYEFNPPDAMEEQEELFFSGIDTTFSPKDEEFIRARVEGILSQLPELDARINSASSGWGIDRIGRVELTLLRIALYEMDNDPDVPVGVAINEAVELARKFGQESAPAFVNAVLSKLTPEGREEEPEPERPAAHHRAGETARIVVGRRKDG